MADKRAPGRSLDEWMKLVTECRQSGLTDAAWCTEHWISPSSFYNAVTRLRKRACQIPDFHGAGSLDEPPLPYVRLICGIHANMMFCSSTSTLAGMNRYLRVMASGSCFHRKRLISG